MEVYKNLRRHKENTKDDLQTTRKNQNKQKRMEAGNDTGQKITFPSRASPDGLHSPELYGSYTETIRKLCGTPCLQLAAPLTKYIRRFSRRRG